jgi:site-specific DNA-methyltransferase (adenine-specific)
MSPYFTCEQGALYQGDCLEVMKQFPEGSIDLVLTDPPYNISRKNNFKTMGRAGIHFGDWDVDFDIRSWIPECSRILRKGGNFVSFCDFKDTSYIIEESSKNNLEIKNILRWVKSNPMPRNRDRRFVSDTEFALYFVKDGGRWVFNRKSETYERPEIVSGLTPKSEQQYGAHPTQKPVSVLQKIIDILSYETSVVFDPFVGSGTTAVACVNTNRKFIGIEQDEKYIEIAKKRVMDAILAKTEDLENL